MHLWGGAREILRVHGVPEGNKSKTKEGLSHTRDGVTQDHERSLEAQRKDNSAQQVRLESNGQVSAFLQNTEAGLHLDG